MDHVFDRRHPIARRFKNLGKVIQNVKGRSSHLKKVQVYVFSGIVAAVQAAFADIMKPSMNVVRPTVPTGMFQMKGSCLCIVHQVIEMVVMLDLVKNATRLRGLVVVIGRVVGGRRFELLLNLVAVASLGHTFGDGKDESSINATLDGINVMMVANGI